MTAGAPEQPRGPGDALRVVARRIRDDAAGEGIGRQRGDRRVRAADLERADRLERLGLQESPVLGPPEGDQRRVDDDAAQALGGRPDVVDA